VDHDGLIKEAEGIAAKLTAGERSEQGYIWAYVANHELRMVIEKLAALTKLVWGILLALVLTLGSAVIGMIFKVLTG